MEYTQEVPTARNAPQDAFGTSARYPEDPITNVYPTNSQPMEQNRKVEHTTSNVRRGSLYCAHRTLLIVPY